MVYSFWLPVSAIGLSYHNERKIPFAKAYANLVEDSISLFFRYLSYLVSSPLIWGVARQSALRLRLTPSKGIGRTHQVQLDVIVCRNWNYFGKFTLASISPHRYSASFLSGTSFMILIACIPVFIELDSIGFLTHESFICL